MMQSDEKSSSHQSLIPNIAAMYNLSGKQTTPALRQKTVRRGDVFIGVANVESVRLSNMQFIWPRASASEAARAKQPMEPHSIWIHKSRSLRFQGHGFQEPKAIGFHSLGSYPSSSGQPVQALEEMGVWMSDFSRSVKLPSWMLFPSCKHHRSRSRHEKCYLDITWYISNC